MHISYIQLVDKVLIWLIKLNLIDVSQFSDFKLNLLSNFSSYLLIIWISS